MIDYTGFYRNINQQTKNEYVSFEYVCTKSGGANAVCIAYEKHYPAEHFREEEQAEIRDTLAEWDVSITVSGDTCASGDTILRHALLVNAAVMMHQAERHFEEVLKK